MLPAPYYYRKCLKINRDGPIKPISENCNFNHPLVEKQVLVSNNQMLLKKMSYLMILFFKVFDSKGTRNRLSQIPSISSSSASLIDTFDGSDPLSQFARAELDPLSQMAAEIESTSISSNAKQKNIPKVIAQQQSSIESWQKKKSIILNRYTTSEKLSIATSFLGGENVVKNQAAVEKVRHRLEQLDDFQDIHYMQNLTQQEYIAKIQMLNAELISAWKTDQRVKSLKIAIQCSKLLSDTSVLQFYPSKFVLITDILDIFGGLVYDRLKSKSEGE